MLSKIEVPKHDENFFVKFTAASVKDLKLRFIETVQKVEVKRSTLEGLEKTLLAGVEAELMLYLQTSEGEFINQPDLKDQVEVLIERAEDVSNVIVDEKEDPYSIQMKTNGDKLPTCPFTVQVKERELVVLGEMELKLFPGDATGGFYGIAVNTEGKIVVVNEAGHYVYVFDRDDNCSRKFGSKGPNSRQFNSPAGVSFLNDNEILIADELNHRIQHVHINIQTGTVVKHFGKHGAGKGVLNHSVDVCLDDEGRNVITDGCGHSIQVLSRDGKTISIFGDSDPEKLLYPRSCVSYRNKFLVTDSDNQCVKVFDQSGTLLKHAHRGGNQSGAEKDNRLLFREQ